jgi:drug/metabolite transporter (DMT)-like permease
VQHEHRTAGVAFAIAAALCTAGYTIWDKHAVQMIPPLVYFTTYTCFLSVAYIISIRREKGPGVVRRAWNEHRSSAILIGFGNAASYVLFLIALRSGVSSYVIGLRQLSIAFGVFLGWRFLGERVTMNRAAGIALLIAGCIIILVTTQ